MSKCSQNGCIGHLGKFSSCLDEAVYLLAQDERWDGDVDFGVSWCVIDLDDCRISLNTGDWIDDTSLVDAGEVVVPVPAGVYCVETTDRGFVYVERWDGVTPWGSRLAEREANYGVWLDSED